MYEIFSRLLEKNHVTTYQVSKATGITQSTFSDWKSGRSCPKMDKLQKIACYFKVSAFYLMGKEVHLSDADVVYGLFQDNLSEEDSNQLEQDIKLLRQEYMGKITASANNVINIGHSAGDVQQVAQRITYNNKRDDEIKKSPSYEVFQSKKHMDNDNELNRYKEFVLLQYKK